MKKIRIENDIEIYWQIFDPSGEPYDLTGKDLIVEMIVRDPENISGAKIIPVPDFARGTNNIVFTFYGKDQTLVGDYFLKLSENRGTTGMRTLDVKEAFTLVPHSWQTGGADSTLGVETEVVALESTMVIGPPGPPGPPGAPGEVEVEEMTQDEYDALPEKDENTLYIVEDPYSNINQEVIIWGRDPEHGMAYVVPDEDEDLTEALVKENTIYEIRYDFDLDGETLSVPEGCGLFFNGGSLSNGTLDFDGTEVYGLVKFGDDMDFEGSCSNHTACQSWFSSVDGFHLFMNEVTGPSVYEYESGEYSPTVNVNKTLYEDITIHGNGARLNFTYNTSGASGQTAFRLVGDKGTVITKDIVSAAYPGDMYLAVDSVNGLSIGDSICIMDSATSSFSYHRNYKQGEFAKIKNIDTVNSYVYLDHALFGTYKHIEEGTCAISKFNTHSINIEDLWLDVTDIDAALQNNFYGLLMYWADGFMLKNVTSNNFSIGIAPYYCQNGEFKNCTSLSNRNIYSSIDNYALILAHCQQVTVDGGRYAAGNHGIATGGVSDDQFGVVDRYITIKNTTTSQWRNNNDAATIDFHGCCDRCSVINNFCGGISVGGSNFTAENNTVTHRGIVQHEVLGYNHSIRFNEVKKGSIFVRMAEEDSSYVHSMDNWTPYTGRETMLITGNKINSEGYITDSASYPLCGFNAISFEYSNISNVTVRVEDNDIFNCRVVVQGCKQVVPSSLTGGATVMIKNNYIHETTDSIDLGYHPIEGYKVYFSDNILENNKREFDFHGMDIEISGNKVYNSRQSDNVAMASVGSVDVSGGVRKLVFRNNYFDSTVRTGLSWSQRFESMLIENNEFDGNFSSSYFVTVAYTGTHTTLGDISFFNNKWGNGRVGRIAGKVHNISFGGNIRKDTGENVRIDIDNPTYSNIFCYDPYYKGSTAARPSWLNSSQIFTYYDTTLGKYILWNGSSWTNIDGTSLST